MYTTIIKKQRIVIFVQFVNKLLIKSKLKLVLLNMIVKLILMILLPLILNIDKDNISMMLILLQKILIVLILYE
jgi:hypothetical protein